jgi:plasmid stabilization system protein ParE
MKGRPVFFTALAEEDLDQIEDCISAHDSAAAARVRSAIVQQSMQLGTALEKGVALKDPSGEQELGVRLWPVSRYRNYLILYKVESDRVQILRLLHAARDWTRFFGNPQ